MMNPEFKHIDILVGSMGAISKLVTTGVYRMNRVRHVVIDEADTMFDDTFSDQLIHFMKRFPVNCHRLLYHPTTMSTIVYCSFTGITFTRLTTTLLEHN